MMPVASQDKKIGPATGLPVCVPSCGFMPARPAGIACDGIGRTHLDGLFRTPESSSTEYFVGGAAMRQP